jgi:hypothetical protein
MMSERCRNMMSERCRWCGGRFVIEPRGVVGFRGILDA